MRANIIGVLKRKKKLLLLIAAALLVVIAFIYFRQRGSQTASAQGAAANTAVVTRRDITSTLSGSGTIAPQNTYTITSMAEGDVVEAAFEEGDQVTEGQILYRIDASSMESELNSAGNSLERAQENYNIAASDYSEAAGKYSGNTYKSTKAGYIKELYISAGDKVSGNTQIADLYNDQVMQIRVPFLNTEAAMIAAGSPAVLTLSDTLEQLTGTVVSVSSLEETLTGGRLIRYVTIEVQNPGGLTTEMTATASIGNFVSTGDGAFTPTVDTVLAADLPATVDAESILVYEGDYLAVGSPIFKMTGSSAERMLKTYKDSLDSAESSLEQAQSNLDTRQDTYDDYTITAPISGTVITKTAKVGDKVQNNSSSDSLAVIYDMSSVTFQMNIDELDIKTVAVGQKVEVAADAFEGETFSGTVTNISLEGTSANGVTYYPVTVTLDEVGELLPGMNVDGTIIVDSAEQVLAVPVDALQRGNTVYVKDETVTEAQGRVPAGFREVSVETGLISTEFVEIVSGELNENDEVYLAESTVQSDAGGMMQMAPMEPGGGAGGGAGGGQGGRGQGGAAQVRPGG